MKYNYCGKSGLQLPLISLGLWHNFGGVDNFSNAKEMILYAFEEGITHFDLANNYGPPPGSAEETFGKIFSSSLKNHRDELIISSKAGHLMWEGPYGDGGSRKSVIASINQSLKRTGLDYFDIFYSHRYDPNTPIEETVQTLIDIVKQGKSLYIGLSKYPAEKAEFAYKMMQEQNTPCLIYQDRYSLFNRAPENDSFPVIKKYGVGFIGFSPLAQGLLTDKYLNGIPLNSRAAGSSSFLKKEDITEKKLEIITQLNKLAADRGQTLAEMALAWILNHPEVTSVLIGASSTNQIKSNIKSINNFLFTTEEIELIYQIINSYY